MAIAGVSDVYSVSNDLLKTFLGIDIAISQVYRVTNLLGEQLTQPLAQPVRHPPLQVDEVIYASIDGSMILTDQGWQEVKLSRLFSSKSRVENGQKGDDKIRFRLEQSTYSAHLGPHQAFTPLFEASLGTYKAQPERLVFVTDGAVWIQHYLAQTYPESTHILDYYHAVEHLANFARLGFKTLKLRTAWLEQQKDHLLKDGLDEVLANLAQLTKLKPTTQQERARLVAYLEQNRSRMQYGSFKNRGLLIGSGPMEAAHRTVIQSRMKRSGQRWTTPGAQAMLNLRVAAKSGQWHLVTNNLNR
jgi:hypothetical protein